MMNNLCAEEIIRKLGLKPLVDEGGFFRETYRSKMSISKGNLPKFYLGSRKISSAIYYLITSDGDSFSALHRLPGDEIYHFYLGDPVTMLLLYPDGNHKEVVLGQDLIYDQHIQFCVPGGVWQGARLVPGGSYALLGATMSPGFEYEDFVLGNRDELIEEYPEVMDRIWQLTR